MDTRRFSLAIIVVVAAHAAFAQEAKPLSVLTVSAGGGMGWLSEGFTKSGLEADLRYLAPGARVDAEIAWGGYFLEMSLAALFSPAVVALGSDAVNLSGYKINMGLDFTALALGYSLPVSDSLQAGASVGFHVSSLALTPPNGDYSRLALEGNYGLIGFNATPRIRYNFLKSLVATLEIPLGIDFWPMSEEVVVGGVDTGISSPAIVSPASLSPTFKGFTIGLYLSFGYKIPLYR